MLRIEKCRGGRKNDQTGRKFELMVGRSGNRISVVTQTAFWLHFMLCSLLSHVLSTSKPGGLLDFERISFNNSNIQSDPLHLKWCSSMLNIHELKKLTGMFIHQ